LASDPGLRRRITFSSDAWDLGQIVDLCLKTDRLGFQVFNAVDDENAVPQPNSELFPGLLPDVPPSRPVGEREGLLSNRKIKEVLGFKEARPWQKDGWQAGVGPGGVKPPVSVGSAVTPARPFARPTSS
jgi:hypothetical protein